MNHLAQKPWIVPIPGTMKSHRLTENLGAASVTLSPDDLRRIGDVLAKVPVQGDRPARAPPGIRIPRGNGWW